MTTIFVSGCFDLVHIGHINLLLFTRQLAGVNGRVIVSLDSDDKISKDKPNRPIFSFNERRKAIKALMINGSALVDSVYDHNDNEQLLSYILAERPKYIVVGSDYKGKYVVGSEQVEVIYFHRDPKFSSTKIIEACQKLKPITS